MGFFETKKKHTVNTTVTRVVEDINVHRSPPTSVIESIMRSDGQIVENVMEGLISGIGTRAHRMYNYAGSHYTYGRPSIAQRDSTYGQDLVLQIIQTLFGATATISYSEYAPLNNLHAGWETLVTEYGYKSSTNQLDTLSALKGTPVYLKDMQVVLTQLTMDEMGVNGLEQWGTPANAGVTPTRPATTVNSQMLATQIKLEPLALLDYVLVTYQWVVATPTVIDNITVNKNIVHEESVGIPFPLILDEDDYFQVKYMYGGNAGYWTYKDGAGTYPDLDALFHPTEAPFGSFFPFAYFRYNNISADTDPTSQGYLTSKKLVKYLGVDYAEMITQVNDNPDIGYVEQAMMIMAVPAISTNAMEQRYLYEFFERMHLNSNNALVSTLDTRQIGGIFKRVLKKAPPRLSWTIQDTRFKMSIGCNNIYRRKQGGVIGPVGTYSSSFAQHPVVLEYKETDENGYEQTYTVTKYVPTHFYRHQITDSVYEEVEVAHLQTRYYVWGGMATVGDELDPILLIPLDYSVTEHYSISDREELYARSLHFVFNSHQVTKIKWYQKSIFKVFMYVLAIVITIFNPPAGMAVFLATATADAILIWLLMKILIHILIAFALKMFVKLVGYRFAFLVAIVTVVAAVYGVIDAGSIAGAPWAQELLSLANGLTSAIGNDISAGMADLQKSAVDFGTYVEEQTKLLDKANDLLDNTSILSPLVIFGETPDDFYNRTVHSGNIGVVGIEAISSYVDVALTLPEPADTMG